MKKVLLTFAAYIIAFIVVFAVVTTCEKIGEYHFGRYAGMAIIFIWCFIGHQLSSLFNKDKNKK